ncbi:sensor histidine kinase [Dactylosporangium sp. CS-033363]|uniref:sensor histidine kinase n=1 Tax=Dactylosporangium sp. CS-033363 TaxID=3239935 RepID=UPI003D900543
MRVTAATGPLPRPSRREWVFDAALAVAVGAVGVQYAWEQSRAPVPVIAAAIAAAVLAVRRRYPLAVLWVVAATLVVAPAEQLRPEFYAAVVAAYSAAAYSPYRIPALGSLAGVAVLAAAAPDSSLPTVPNEYVPFAILVPIIIAANGRRAWRQRAAAEAERVKVQERALLARELHDVVTHHVSMMIIQAGAARISLAKAPEQAAGALLAVEASGREAMADLRQVMGLLAPPASPRPGLTGRLETLVEGVRSTGIQISYRTAGVPRGLPEPVELAAYRVVQEALTNTVKHAEGAAAEVEVRFAADGVTVEVTDTGGSAGAAARTGGTPRTGASARTSGWLGAAARSGGGRGLKGLRARVEALGGTFAAGPTAAGGFTVTATFSPKNVTAAFN